MKLVRDGVVIALMKLINVESVLAHRLVSGCLANLTTTRDVTWELLQANGHKVNHPRKQSYNVSDPRLARALPQQITMPISVFCPES